MATKVITVEEQTRKGTARNQRVKAQAERLESKLFVIRTPLYGTEEQKNQEPYFTLGIDPIWVKGEDGEPKLIERGSVVMTLGEGVTDNEHWARWIKSNYPLYDVYEYNQGRGKFAPLDARRKSLASKLDAAIAANDFDDDEDESESDEDDEYLPEDNTPIIEK